MVEISDAFVERIDKSKAKDGSFPLGFDEGIIREEAKLAVAKEELRIAEQRMNAVGLSRDDLPPAASYVDQQATAAYLEFRRTHNV